VPERSVVVPPIVITAERRRPGVPKVSVQDLTGIFFDGCKPTLLRTGLLCPERMPRRKKALPAKQRKLGTSPAPAVRSCFSRAD
jgi:hypothetical protein